MTVSNYRTNKPGKITLRCEMQHTQNHVSTYLFTYLAHRIPLALLESPN